MPTASAERPQITAARPGRQPSPQRAPSLGARSGSRPRPPARARRQPTSGLRRACARRLRRALALFAASPPPTALCQGQPGSTSGSGSGPEPEKSATRRTRRGSRSVRRWRRICTFAPHPSALSPVPASFCPASAQVTPSAALVMPCAYRRRSPLSFPLFSLPQSTPHLLPLAGTSGEGERRKAGGGFQDAANNNKKRGRER